MTTIHTLPTLVSFIHAISTAAVKRRFYSLIMFIVFHVICGIHIYLFKIKLFTLKNIDLSFAVVYSLMTFKLDNETLFFFFTSLHYVEIAATPKILLLCSYIFFLKFFMTQFYCWLMSNIYMYTYVNSNLNLVFHFFFFMIYRNNK